MRTKIYLAIIEKLKTITGTDGSPVIKYFDLWNQNVDFIDQDAPWPRPAIFVEFGHIDWKNLSQGIQQADVPIILHIVTDWKGGTEDGNAYQATNLSDLDLLDTINGSLTNFSKDFDDGLFRAIQRISSDTNHNHEEIVENIETYSVYVRDHSGVR